MNIKRLLTTTGVIMLLQMTYATFATLHGVYRSDTDDSYFSVSGDTLIVYSNATGDYPLSVCHVDMIDDNFIKVTTMADLSQSQIDVEVCDTTATVADSLYIKFVTPPAVLPSSYFLMSVAKLSESPRPVCYGTDVTRLARPAKKQDALLTVMLMPEKYVPDNDHNQYYGLMYFNLPDIQLKGHNYAKIQLPFMDEFFFRKYYICGEYMKVNDNVIMWRGISYRRHN